MEDLIGRRVVLGRHQCNEDELHDFMATTDTEDWFKKRIGKEGIIKNVFKTNFFNITVKFSEDGYTNDFNIKELVLINPNKRIL